MKLFDAYPSLKRAGFNRFRGSLTAYVERDERGRFVLTLPPGDRWVGFVDELVSLEPRLTAAGISKVVVCSKAPRHAKPPLKEEDVTALRAAWSDRLEIREVL